MAQTPPGFVKNINLHQKKRVSALTFSPRGKILASASEDRTLRLGHVETGEQLTIQPQGRSQWGFVAVAISPDGYTIASVSQGAQKATEDMMEPCLWQPIPQTRTLPGRERKYSYQFLSPSFSPTERLIVFACDRVRLFDVDTGDEHHQFPNKPNYPQCVCFAPDGKHLATGNDDGSIAVWTVAGKRIRQLEGHDGVVTALAFSPDGKLLASAGKDGSVRAWNFSSGKQRKLFEGDWKETTLLTFLPDSLRLISFHDSDEPGIVRQWHIKDDTKEEAWSLANRRMSSVALSPNGEQIAVGHPDGKITLWERAVVLNDPEQTLAKTAPKTQSSKPVPKPDGGENYFEGID